MPLSPSRRKPFGEDDAVHSSTSATSLSDYDHDDAESLLKHPASRGPRQPRLVRLLAWLRTRPRNVRRVFRRNAILVAVKYALLVLLAVFVGTPILAPSYLHPPMHYKELADRCAGPSATPGCANPFKEKVFIAVSLYDPEGRHAGGAWGNALLEVIHLIGEDNVFLSIYENDSGAAGSHALDLLEKRLRCRHELVNEPHVSLDAYPTIELPDGTNPVKRLAYLSDIRNRALRPLDTFSPGTGAFDKILFLNDVSFHPVDAAQLLFSTNVGQDGRTQYLSTCGMDFMNPLLFYDLYAQRDAEGYSNGLPIFPFFSRAGRGTSRAAMLAQTDAVPVSSCWGGIVAMQAKYVQNLKDTLPDPNFQAIGSPVIDPASPRNVTSPVRFRYEPEVFVDACECCLFLADVAQVARREEGKELGTYVNPYVRVAYDLKALSWLPWVKRWERLFSVPQAILSTLLHLPTRNPHRAVQEGDGFMEEIWVNEGGSWHWKLTQREARNGLFCEVREMQTILKGERTEDKNWQNAKIPAGQTLNFPS